ncbi:MAG: DNA-processing protein DprA [Myxococcota bacterium]|nr:DNA-processing protein DprA [Myxococcota bacterium]
MPNVHALCSLQIYLKPKTFTRVLEEVPEVLEAQSAAELYHYLQSDSSIPIPPKRRLLSSWRIAQENATHYQESGISTLPFWSSDFPSLSAPVLYVKGDPSWLRHPLIIAVVGRRAATDIGRKAAYRFAKHIGKAGGVVLSGLAKGCDAQAHRGALHSHAPNIAVLAHGLHMIYPSEHKELSQKICEHGCLVSEYPWGTPPNRSAFIQRNRWQVALSKSVILIESGKSGGSMHTVRFAQETQKPYYCFWHKSPQWQNSAEGNRILITKGAKSIENKEDLNQFRLALSKIMDI